MATRGGQSRLNSGSTVVLACGVSMPTKPREAYSSDMLLRGCGAGILDDLAERDDIARDAGGQIFRRAGNDDGALRLQRLFPVIALQRRTDRPTEPPPALLPRPPSPRPT